MKISLLTAAATLLLGTAVQANAQNNVIELLGEAADIGNFIELNITGTNNALSLSQVGLASGISGNQMTISIDGDNNGGPSGTVFSGIALHSGLEPGTLSQTGYGNSMAVEVQGSSNLFAFVQHGSNNSLSATIQGTGNQAAVQQFGQNNHVSMQQTGSGNSINISQRSF